MSNGGKTRREFERELKEFREPKRITLAEALAAPDPIHELSRRLACCGYEQMSAPEQMFYSATMFLGDTLNGGLDQTLFNSTGDDFDLVADFAARYCEPVGAVLADLSALFPNGRVPSSRDERSYILATLADLPADPLGILTSRFYALEPTYRSGLLALVREHASDFASGLVPVDVT